MKIKSAKELIQERKNKYESNKKRYDKILEACINRIEKTNSLTKDTNIMFELPDNLGISCPTYDKEECCKYMKDILLKNGYVVELYNNRFLKISWDEELVKEAANDELDVLLRLSNNTKKYKFNNKKKK
jgi:hypothetical protein